MTLNGVMAVISRYFIEFDIFEGQLRHNGRGYTYTLDCDKMFSKESSFGSMRLTVIL